MNKIPIGCIKSHPHPKTQPKTDPTAAHSARPQNPVNDWLVKEHFAHFGTPPDFFAAGIAVVKAIRKAGVAEDTDALIAAMKGMEWDSPKITALNLRDRIALWAPFLLVPVLIIAGFIAIGAPSSWLTLTVSGLAMEMMIFIMASGMAPLFRWRPLLGFRSYLRLGIGRKVMRRS